MFLSSRLLIEVETYVLAAYLCQRTGLNENLYRFSSDIISAKNEIKE